MVANNPAAEVRLRKSSGGVFEITVNGELRFSKRQLGRFPTEAEVLAALA
jgi:selT/selW/selH-like putative selenoprotein